MNRADFKRMMKARVHTPSIGSGETRKRNKRADSAEIELLTRDFLANGGQIQQIENRETEFQPTWRAYAATAFDERGEV
ncbi:hypothetical protein LL254_00510 [Marinobacter nauticus]|uniref:hypothetical protein n=1 Tax=Marinobacter nauticus TaxID=2743 RepID=UPI001D18683E|nr:hypothetical protein [Marinobacter nauticus]MCC4269188.1 hypothetical protein [Marinobacter nauticus]